MTAQPSDQPYSGQHPQDLLHAQARVRSRLRRRARRWPRARSNFRFLFERFQSPREITDEVIRSAFEALAASAR